MTRLDEIRETRNKPGGIVYGHDIDWLLGECERLREALKELYEAVEAERLASISWYKSPRDSSSWDAAGKRRREAMKETRRALADGEG